jgi:osmotically-inducible protein OsmY
MFMKKMYQIICLLFLSFALVACATGPKKESTGQYIDSSTITTKVKAKLASQLGMRAFSNISVTTYKGTVQLSGFVRSQELKNKASAVAGKVSGVTKVENNLLVKT